MALYDDYDFPDDSSSTEVGDGIYYDGGLYGPDGGPDTPATSRDDEK
ncbi:hypothetical protein [Streptomyces sp. NPDC091383]